MANQRPGGPIASRPLHLIFLADCSGSMAGDKIQSLNHAIRESMPAVAKVAAENPTALVVVRAIAFEEVAKWHIAAETPIDQAKWIDLTFGGGTSMGAALKLAATALHSPPMPDRALPPVLVLITDGQPTDDFEAGLKALLAEPWGLKAVRIGIAIGHDADHGPLERFRSNSEMPVLQANNAEDLAKFIKWASTQAVKAASQPASQQPAAPGAPAGNVAMPTPPPPASANDVW